jgi:hypothetical protein
MKKTLIIVLKSGRIIERDLTLVKLDNVPIGSPANHEGYAQLCMFIATNGTTDVDVTSENQLTYIAPASIETVTVKFG